MSTNASGSPVLSLLIPIYNVQRYLRECLDSALAQTLKDIEIICINDGSTDNSPAIIREYMERDRRVKMIDKANSGYGDSMNHGLEMARGKYVGILESDDFMAPDALEKLVSAADSNNADFAKANFDLYWSKPEERRSLHEMFKAKDCGKPVHPSDTTQFFKQKPSIWSAVYRRDFLERNGIKFLPTPGASFQDTSFAFKVIACADKAVYLHDAVLSYRQDNENSSVNSSAKVFCVNTEYARLSVGFVRIMPATTYAAMSRACSSSISSLSTIRTCGTTCAWRLSSIRSSWFRWPRSSKRPWTPGTFRLTTSSRGSARISLPSSKILRAGLTSIRVLRRMVPWGVLSITPRLEVQAWSPPSSSNR